MLFAPRLFTCCVKSGWQRDFQCMRSPNVLACLIQWSAALNKNYDAPHLILCSASPSHWKLTFGRYSKRPNNLSRRQRIILQSELHLVRELMLLADFGKFRFPFAFVRQRIGISPPNFFTISRCGTNGHFDFGLRLTVRRAKQWNTFCFLIPPSRPQPIISNGW
jgi:hypothetical protein